MFNNFNKSQLRVMANVARHFLNNPGPAYHAQHPIVKVMVEEMECMRDGGYKWSNTDAVNDVYNKLHSTDPDVRKDFVAWIKMFQ